MVLEFTDIQNRESGLDLSGYRGIDNVIALMCSGVFIREAL